MSSRIRTNSQGKRSINGRNNSASGSTRTQWSTQSYTIENILDQFSFPCVARCDPHTLFTKRSQPLPINLSKPILLYEKRIARKLLARNVLFDPRAQRFGETDETVVIPADYEGNFLRMNYRTARDENVYKGVESLATNKVPAFINVTQLTAFQIGLNQNSNIYPRIEFSPGNVFIVDKIFKGTSTQKLQTVDDKPETSKQELRYLKCRDERNSDFLVPLEHPGEFMEVLPNPNEGSKLSMSSADIIELQKFPQLLRYVYGGTMPRLTAYSGLFTALDSFEETSLVGCVLNLDGFTLIEIPLNSPLSFQIALIDDPHKVPALKQAIRLCEQKSNHFARDMKFKFKFSLRILENSPEAKKVLDEDDPPSVTNSARFGISSSFIYL